MSGPVEERLPVLLVDDDRMYSAALERYLRKHALPVTVCNLTSQVTELTSRRFRAAVLDVYVEGDQDGLRLLETLRATQPELPVVFITGLASDRLRSSLRKIGANRLLTKPFPLAHLFDVLEELLEVGPLESADHPAPLLLAQAGHRSDEHAQALTSAGYRVFRAYTHAEAITILEECPILTAIVVDEALPGGACQVCARAEALGLRQAMVVLASPDVSATEKPRGHATVEPAAGTDGLLQALRSLGNSWL